MPYEEHILFTNPEETVLWRYMDFTKFVSLLNTNSLFFSRARLLQNIDPWEGSYLKKELEYRLKEDLSLKEIEDKTNEYEFVLKSKRRWGKCYEHQIDINFISCWHYDSCESAAMWRLYLKSNEGICIKTYVNAFRKSFDPEDRKVYIGKVQYKDYENDTYSYPNANLFSPFIHKRKIYDHEKEYRAIVNDDTEDAKLKKGILVKVNLQTLIRKIILAPSSPDWFEELVKATLKKYDLDFPISKSEVDDKPYDFDLSPYEPKKD